MADDGIPLSRICTKCGIERPLDEFYAAKQGKFGRRTDCKVCVSKRSSARHKKDRLENGEAVRRRQQQWRCQNAEKVKQLKRLDYKKRRAVVIAKSIEWIRNNKDRRSESQQKWRDENRQRVRNSQKKARAKFRATAKGKLHLAIGSTLRASLKLGKGGKRTFAVLGYSIEELMNHLEAGFLPGMSWANYGIKGWHVDHIVPIAAHNFETVEDIDFKKAWALSNLRPLWAHDNHKKSKTLLAPFQPSLLLREIRTDGIHSSSVRSGGT